MDDSASSRSPVRWFYCSAQKRLGYTLMGDGGQWSMSSAYLAGKYVIDPRDSVLLPYWDSMVVVFIVWISLATPYQVGFDLFQEVTARSTLWHASALSINLVFALDIILQFFTSFPHPVNRRWVRMPKSIVKSYVRGCFIPDLLSVVPYRSIVDYLTLRSNDDYSFWGVFQILRLLTLLRIYRLNARYEARIDVPYTWLKLANLTVILCFSFHWMACAWGYLLTIEKHLGWYEGFTWGDALRDDKPSMFQDPRKPQPFELYIASLYWSAMTITTTGYGDVTACNVIEMWAALSAMAFSGLIWANIIGSVCAIASSLDAEKVYHESNMDALNNMMHHLDLPQDNRTRLRELFRCRKVLYHRERQVDLLRSMSPELQGKVARWVQGNMLGKVWFFRDSHNDAFVVGLFESFQFTVYPPRELVILPQTLVCVQQGVALNGAKVLAPKSIWGMEDVLLSNPLLLDGAKPLSLSYLEIQYLVQDVLFRLILNFPEDKKRIRTASIWIGIARAVAWGVVRPLTQEELEEMEIEAEHNRMMAENKLEENMWHLQTLASEDFASPYTRAVQSKIIEKKLQQTMLLLERYGARQGKMKSRLSGTSASHEPGSQGSQPGERVQVKENVWVSLFNSKRPENPPK